MLKEKVQHPEGLILPTLNRSKCFLKTPAFLIPRAYVPLSRNQIQMGCIP